VNYLEINNLVYMSNPYWQGVYDLSQEAVRSWGVALPPAPDISLVPGDLPPGKYSLCFTRVEDGRMSGNGPLAQVAWEGGAQGIRLNNLVPGYQCWITHAGGGKLFLAEVAGEVIISQAPQVKPLPTFMVTPPPCFTHFRQAFGRVWGCAGKHLYYSEPFQYEWFKAGNFIPFLEDLVMAAPVTNGLFVNSRTSTWFLEGTNPGEMSLRRIGGGAVPGTLVSAQLPGAVVGGGYEISRRSSQLPSPVWMSRNGLVVGTHTGHLVHLTEARLRINPRNQGAGFYQVKDGIPRVTTSLRGLPAKDEPDGDLRMIFHNGRLFPPAPFEAVATGNWTIN